MKQWQRHYTTFFRKAGRQGHYQTLPDAFKIDPKIMMPKPGKSDYNTVRSNRPITLESVIGKEMERVICRRLTWKLEVEGGIASTQNAYRRQKSCVQSLVRLCNSVIPLFHTGPESHELTRIDKYLDSWLNRTQFVKVLTDLHSP